MLLSRHSRVVTERPKPHDSQGRATARAPPAGQTTLLTRPSHGAERLRHSHRDGGLARARLPSDHDRAARDVALLDHLEDDAGRLARIHLPHHALADHARLERVVEAEAADVAVRADAFDAREILDLRHLHALSSLGHLLSLSLCRSC